MTKSLFYYFLAGMLLVSFAGNDAAERRRMKARDLGKNCIPLLLVLSFPLLPKTFAVETPGSFFHRWFFGSFSF